MAQLSDIEVLSNYAQFKGNKFSKVIEFGVDTDSSAILLEGTTVFYQVAGDEQSYIKTYAMLTRAGGSVTDNVGSLSFWIENNEIRCQLSLVAARAVFDDIYETLCTLKENLQYNFFITTNVDKLAERNNAIKTYSMSFVEIE